MTTSKLVKPHTPHPTPHTLPPPKSFFSKPYLNWSGRTPFTPRSG
ncbi:hypothetical protein [Microcystis aeruginosa]|nr:hypothetical protein [Microcystis aeruginosa]